MTDPKVPARPDDARPGARGSGSVIWLDVGGETVACVAGWGEDGALEAVTEFAETIDELARRIESALQEALDRALVAVRLGARRWAAVPQDRGEDAGVGGDDGDYLLRRSHHDRARRVRARRPLLGRHLAGGARDGGDVLCRRVRLGRAEGHPARYGHAILRVPAGRERRGRDRLAVAGRNAARVDHARVGGRRRRGRRERGER